MEATQISKEFMKGYEALRSGRGFDRDWLDELYEQYVGISPTICIKCGQRPIGGHCCGFTWHDRRGVLPDMALEGPKKRPGPEPRSADEIRILLDIAQTIKDRIRAVKSTQILVSQKMGHHKSWVSRSLTKLSLPAMREIVNYLGVKIG